MITNVGGEDGHRHVMKHPYSPLYVPFTFKRESYTLHPEKAVWAEDVTPGNVNVYEHHWRLHPLKIRGYEQERMDVIFNKMAGSLETLIQRSVHLGARKRESRDRFLGIFPAPLRAGFREENCYGTINVKELRFGVYLEDLPSIKREFVTPTSKANRIPIHFFNR